jgi:dipeptidyl aminopeptidase/acylaminoacyl peptidase
MLRVLVLATLLLAPLNGQAPGRPMTPHDVVSLRQVTQMALSPDGETIAFTISVPRAPADGDGAAFRELHVMDYDIGTSRALVGGEVSVSDPVFTPDGTAVLALERRGDDAVRRVWSHPLDGSAPTALSPAGVAVSAFALAGDGAHLAFLSRRKKDDEAAELASRGFDQIVFEEDQRPVEMWLMRSADRALRRIALDGSVHEIAWAPDHETVVFTMAPTPAIDDRYMRRDLYAVHLPTNATRRLADVPGKFGVFAVSPNGRRVAYTAGRDLHDPSASSLYVVGMKGGWSTSLTPPDFEGEIRDVEWYRDDVLLAMATEGCHRTLFLQPAGGGNRLTILPRGKLALEAFAVEPKNARLATIAHTADHPREVYTFDLSDHSDELATMVRGDEPNEEVLQHCLEHLGRRTDCNPTLAEMARGEQEVIRYAARDGLEIEGLIIKPVGYEEGKRYPLICVIHGGPESQFLDGWVTRYATPGHMGAARGYLQFLPNYRSSTGRGVAFSKMGQGDAAGAEFTDVLDGIDHLVEAGLADPERVGITGGSYGGYFSAWGATRYSERFRAAVMFVGVSNQLSKVGTTDIPQESWASHWKVRPWEAPELYLERSPILYTPNANTPLLILHGKDDPRVSPTQSVELYRWLKIKGDVPVRLVLYPREGHGNRRHASQLDYALRAMRWWDHFLAGDGEDLPPSRVEYDRR